MNDSDSSDGAGRRTPMNLAAIALAGSYCLLLAADAAAHGERFRMLDANSDGMLRPCEARADPVIRARFTELDWNSNGTLSEAEFTRSEGDGINQWWTPAVFSIGL